MRRLAFLAVVAAGLVVPTAAASPTVRLAIVHVVRGCHVWATADSRPLGATRTVDVARGTRLVIRISCPMAFDVVQLSGPTLALGERPWQSGTSHVLVLAKKGVYRLRATNLQSSAEMGLQTLGRDATPLLTVRVR